ncbi:androgen-dependent TFPI-regulating protein-like [Sitophilus oryzae]|uniref:Androgen-dependent TFPI-regulating protein-like n=1 Tax=Sitophilus oryzae TaxID=7048 RepID=A0A6J2Y6M3_SITOR|nr:androgen-dependent TFPI-regulating protein-like [Sitophilus oryzae]
MRQIRSVLGPIFHVGFVAHHLVTFRHSHEIHKTLLQMDIDKTDQRILDMKNFGAVFFTNWNLVIQTIYFSMAVWYDILNIFGLKSELKKGKLDRWKGFLFTSFVFPCSVFVSALFWSVYSINREWVLPEVCDEYVPEWLNHSVHTNVTVFLIIEVLITNQLLPSFKSAFTALTVLTIIYDLIFFVTYFTYGRWIYGLFHVFTWPERIFFILFNYCFSIVIMKIGIAIENFKYTLRRTKINKD